jgi:hypothetical protein
MEAGQLLPPERGINDRGGSDAPVRPEPFLDGMSHIWRKSNQSRRSFIKGRGTILSMKLYGFHFSIAVIAMAGLTSCQQQQSSQDLKEKTAQTTAEVKRDVKAIGAGIREGWNRDKPLDLNAATKGDLESLPGLSADDAERILAARPYSAPDDLVKRHILSQGQFDRVSDRVVAK